MSFRPQRIAGCMGWGHLGMWPHNKLPLSSFKTREGGELYQAGVDPKAIDWRKKHDFARFFRYPVVCQGGEMLALEEWVDPRCREKARSRIVVFNSTTGEEVMDHGCSTVTEVEKYGPVSLPVKDLDFEASASPPRPPAAQEGS